jgi:hypothetical protein
VLLKSMPRDEARDHAEVAHALAVRAAVAAGNYARFFRLRAAAPNLSGALMDFMAHTTRLQALQRMTEA